MKDDKEEKMDCNLSCTGASVICICFSYIDCSAWNTSFTDWTIGTSPTFAGLKNYIYLFTEDEDFRKVIVNTIIWIVLQSTIHVCIGTTLALILRRKNGIQIL